LLTSRSGYVALNLCLRSPRTRRVRQARASLACLTPLLLRGGSDGHRTGQQSEIHRLRCRACRLQGWVGLCVRPGGLLPGLANLSGKSFWSAVRCSCTKQPMHFSSPCSSSLQPALAASPAQRKPYPWRSFSRAGLTPNTVRANPSVKGTKCGKPHFAPYVER
jgi:hypothetical protein